MVKSDGGADAVVGHSRLSSVVGRDASCLIESVVVRRDLRGKGFGKELMKKSEEFARRSGFTTMYLSTHDKQEFYRHIGYSVCEPILCVSASNLSEHLIKKLIGLEIKFEESTEDSPGEMDPHRNLKSSERQPPPPLPPPPPPPPHIGRQTPVINRWDPNAISWMKKNL
ncbi:hypothetical protein ScPMuIL_014246 [Solemya velum]